MTYNERRGPRWERLADDAADAGSKKRDGGASGPKQPPRSAERRDWWSELERLLGHKLSNDQRELAGYLKTAGHTLRQTHSLVVRGRMEQEVYQRRDRRLRAWAFCEVLGTSASGTPLVLIGKTVLECDRRDVVTLRQMVEEGDRLKYDPRRLAGAWTLTRPAARPLPAPPLPAGRVSAHDNPLDHAVYQDWRRLTWAYCDVAPGTRAGRVLVRRLGFEFEFECAAKNVTTLRQMIDAGDSLRYDPSGLLQGWDQPASQLPGAQG